MRPTGAASGASSKPAKASCSGSRSSWPPFTGTGTSFRLRSRYPPSGGRAGSSAWSRSSPTSVRGGMPSGGVASDRNAVRAKLAGRAGLHGNFVFAVTNGRKVIGVIALFSREVRSLDRPTLRVMADIGSQIGQFIERRRAEEELRRSSDRVRAVLESVPEGILTLDERLQVRSINSAAQRLFGVQVDEVAGKDFGGLIAEPNRGELRPQLRSYLRARDERAQGTHETVGQRKDGTTI